MAFGDVKTPKGLQELNNFLADHSYIEGYVPSKADLSVFDALGKAPAGDYVHVQRWYRHIASFSSQERAAWGGQALPQVAGGKPTVAALAKPAAKLKEERLAAYNAKKSKKPALIAKSSIILDVKPWDDETDMNEMQKNVRSIEMDGLLWGAAKLVPVGYGINKLQICCVIEDDKVSVDELQEKIQDFEDFVQSVDIAAFNKI
ncbi:AAEL000951-PB [Aedes aegypti]|uniref:AAEL000951-PB n=1 Tax=Aedes aegypti TaxID=7159 RepID=Q17MM4_AEDAE|nr:AAEL000951-PB [Aedes aegypti]